MPSFSRRKGNVPEINRLLFGERSTHSAERRESRQRDTDTDSRLLTERWGHRVPCGQALACRVLVFNDKITMASSVLA
jgi:hypothetical protein